MNSTFIAHHNLLQAYGLPQLMGKLTAWTPNQTRPIDDWRLELERSDYDDKTYIGLCNGKEHVYVTTSPLDMVTYIQAILALEGE